MVRKISNRYPSSIFFKDTPDFPLRVWIEENQENGRPHCHEFWECAFITSGHGCHQSEDNPPVPICEGDILVIPPGGYHAFSQIENLLIINLIFDWQRLPSPLLELYSKPAYQTLFIRNLDWYIGKNYPHFHADTANFGEMKEYLLRLAKTDSSQSHCYCLGLFMALLNMICDSLDSSESESEYIPLDILKISDFLERNFNRKVYLQELATLTNMSQTTLLRYFRNAFGMSPMLYLQRVRLKKAAHMLTNSSYTLKEIAEITGFPSESYFFRAFKKNYKVSPSFYRKNKAYW